jgi:TonB family protein
MGYMTGDPETRQQIAEAHRALLREQLIYIGELRQLWQAVSDSDFGRRYRAKYFGDYRITRLEALDLLNRWEREISAQAEGFPEIKLQLLWEVPSIQRLMWQHLMDFFAPPAPTRVRRPVTSRPIPADHLIVREHFPGYGVILALGFQLSLLFITFDPVTHRAYQKLSELQKNRTIAYYKMSDYLPEVFSPGISKELPKTAKRIPKRNQTVISNPPEPDNEFQTIIQPGAPKVENLGEIKLPNIISTKPKLARPIEPPLPTINPGSMNALKLPKELVIPIPPALPPKADAGHRALSDIRVAESEALNPQARLLLKPNAEVPDVQALPMTAFGNTYANMPMPKGPDAVPTVTPEIGRFAQVDMPNVVVLNVNPAPPGKEVKVPNISRGASFSTEEGSGAGGGGGKPGTLNIPGITVQGGGLTEPGAAVVQTDKPPEQIAANIPPRDRTGTSARKEGAPSNEKPPELILSKPRRLTTADLAQLEAPGSKRDSKKDSAGGERPKKVYTAYLNLVNLTSRSGSWVMRFSEYEDPTLTASRAPLLTGDPEAELTAPRLLHSEHPRYPPAAIYEKVQGDVILCAIIRRDGKVDEVRVEHSVDERLDKAAMDAIRRWTFLPSEKNGKPVDVFAEITIPFSLKRID